MPIAVRCPECDKALRVPDKLAGRQVKCPQCSAVVLVPATDTPEDESAAKPASEVRTRPERAKPVDDIQNRQRPRRDEKSDDDADKRPTSMRQSTKGDWDGGKGRKPANRPIAIPDDDDEDEVDERPTRKDRRSRPKSRTVNVLGVVSVCLAAGSIALALVPCIGFISIPVSIIALLLGIAALIVAAAGGKWGLITPPIGIVLSIVAIAVPFISVAVLGYFVTSASRKIEEADKLYSQGKKKEAVAIYKENVDSKQVDVMKKNVCYQRIVDFEVEQGNLQEAKKWMEHALNERDPLFGLALVTPEYKTDKAKELQKELQAKRDGGSRKVGGSSAKTDELTLPAASSRVPPSRSSSSSELGGVDAGPARALEPANKNAVNSVCFGSSGKILLSASRDGTAAIWDLTTGKRKRTYDAKSGGPIFCATLSADEQTIFAGVGDGALGGAGGNFGIVWSTGGPEFRKHTCHSKEIWAVAISADGKYLLSGSDDHEAVLCRLDKLQKEVTYKGHDDRVTAVAFSADSKYVLTGSRDKTAIVWDTATGERRQALKGHTSAVTSVAFSSDGQRILTGSDDTTAILWDVSTGQPVRTFKGHAGEVTAVALSGDGSKVLTGSVDHFAILWDVESGKPLRIFKGHKEGVRSVALTPEATHIATGSEDGIVRIWDLP